MDKSIDNFKEFVRNNNYLIGYIKRGKKSWQDLYELYDLYGEDENAWREFLKEDYINKSKISNNKSSNYIEEMVRMAKNIDVDKVQEGITSLQKTLGLFGELFTNKSNVSSTKEYNPRPLYRRFED